MKYSTRKVQNIKTGYFFSLKHRIYVQLNLKMHNSFYWSTVKQQTSAGVKAAFCVQIVNYHTVTREHVRYFESRK